jgi:hypothetical protein
MQLDPDITNSSIQPFCLGKLGTEDHDLETLDPQTSSVTIFSAWTTGTSVDRASRVSGIGPQKRFLKSLHDIKTKGDPAVIALSTREEFVLLLESEVYLCVC